MPRRARRAGDAAEVAKGALAKLGHTVSSVFGGLVPQQDAERGRARPAERPASWPPPWGGGGGGGGGLAPGGGLLGSLLGRIMSTTLRGAVEQMQTQQREVRSWALQRSHASSAK